MIDRYACKKIAACQFWFVGQAVWPTTEEAAGFSETGGKEQQQEALNTDPSVSVSTFSVFPFLPKINADDL